MTNYNPINEIDELKQWFYNNSETDVMVDKLDVLESWVSRVQLTISKEELETINASLSGGSNE